MSAFARVHLLLYGNAVETNQSALRAPLVLRDNINSGNNKNRHCAHLCKLRFIEKNGSH